MVLLSKTLLKILFPELLTTTTMNISRKSAARLLPALVTENLVILTGAPAKRKHCWINRLEDSGFSESNQTTLGSLSILLYIILTTFYWIKSCICCNSLERSFKFYQQTSNIGAENRISIDPLCYSRIKSVFQY